MKPARSSALPRRGVPLHPARLQALRLNPELSGLRTTRHETEYVPRHAADRPRARRRRPGYQRGVVLWHVGPHVARRRLRGDVARGADTGHHDSYVGAIAIVRA